MAASNLANELTALVQAIVGKAQIILHAILVVVGLLLLLQELNWTAGIRLISGSFQHWVYAAGFAYLIRR